MLSAMHICNTGSTYPFPDLDGRYNAVLRLMWLRRARRIRSYSNLREIISSPLLSPPPQTLAYPRDRVVWLKKAVSVAAEKAAPGIIDTEKETDSESYECSCRKIDYKVVSLSF